ncbi:MAG: M14 family metallopeptidase, partial [Oligoflexia bacterium]
MNLRALNALSKSLASLLCVLRTASVWSLWLLSFASNSHASLTRTYADVTNEMRRITQEHPEHAVLFDLGLSDSGAMIQGLKLGRGPIHNLVVATHHGNEYGSTEVALAFAQELALKPIDGQTIFLIPVLNVGGYDRRRRNEEAQGRSWDPNRNYPSPCGTQGPFTLRSTQALAAFLEKQQIVASATLHTYYPAVVWPWGISTHDLSTPYDSDFMKLASAATLESRYRIGNSTEVMYPADGTFEDYAFWQHGVWSLLFELGFSHSPTAYQVAEMFRVNLQGIRRRFELAQQV